MMWPERTWAELPADLDEGFTVAGVADWASERCGISRK